MLENSVTENAHDHAAQNDRSATALNLNDGAAKVSFLDAFNARAVI